MERQVSKSDRLKLVLLEQCGTARLYCILLKIP
jgi:hypothetical protein